MKIFVILYINYFYYLTIQLKIIILELLFVKKKLENTFM